MGPFGWEASGCFFASSLHLGKEHRLLAELSNGTTGQSARAGFWLPGSGPATRQAR